MINKVEAIGIGVSVMAMSLALFLINFETSPVALEEAEQAASVFVANSGNERAALADAVVDATSISGELEKIIIDDIVLGDGKLVKEGDTVTVDYIGALQNGQQFDNSYLRGEPFIFTVGEGRVIEGWEIGILGMQVGGQRILVIPARMAYGSEDTGPIPSNSTLVFALELISINE